MTIKTNKIMSMTKLEQIIALALNDYVIKYPVKHFEKVSVRFSRKSLQRIRNIVKYGKREFVQHINIDKARIKYGKMKAEQMDLLVNYSKKHKPVK